MPTPPPTSSGRRAVARAARSRCPSGPSSQSPSPARSSAEPLGARADVLEQELELAVAARAATENARGRNGPLVLAPAPPLGRGEHVELARPRARARRGRRREHDVGAELAALGDRAARRRPNGASVRRAQRSALTRAWRRARAAWSSCSESTSRLALRARAAIARAAAIAAGQRRDARDAARDRGAADLVAVGARAGAGRRVDRRGRRRRARSSRRRAASPRRSC